MTFNPGKRERRGAPWESGKRLLFIEPQGLQTDEPIIDELTKRMVGALRTAIRPDYAFCGIHSCVCGAISDSTDRILANGWITNTLCVHYLAYHRAEVPVEELDAVHQLAASKKVPSPAELGAPEFRGRREPVDSITVTMNDPIEEVVDRDNEIVQWRYELVLDNRSGRACCLRQASFTLSLDAAYSAPEILAIGWTLAPGEKRRLPHSVIFRVADFRQERLPQIAASLTAASHKAVTWEFTGTYADGKPLRLKPVVVALPSVYKWNQAR